MCEGAQRLRALAEQSRLRSRRTGRGDQAKSLRALAELYERQAADLEFRVREASAQLINR
jgi:hypothetical protein